MITNRLFGNPDYISSKIGKLFNHVLIAAFEMVNT